MGDLSFSNGLSNGNGVHGNGHAVVSYSHRKSCWYEEEIEENLRWCFALNRYLLTLFAHFSTFCNLFGLC